MKLRKRLLVALLVLMTILVSLVAVAIPASAATTSTVLYLKPNSNWTQDGARFAAYFFGNGEKWVSMTDLNSDGVYEVQVPTDKTYPSVIFCRMNPSCTTNSWNYKWNQTGNLTIPTDGKNFFTVPSDTWDGSTSTWSQLASSFTVAGETGLTGAAWSVAETGNDMTLTSDAIYEKTFTGIAAGTYEFKIAANHKWEYSWGKDATNGNASVAVALDNSTVVVTFNETNKAITTTVTHVHTGGTATCAESAVCSVCGESYGELADHNYVNGVCSVCDDKKAVEIPDDITISDETKKEILENGAVLGFAPTNLPQDHKLVISVTGIDEENGKLVFDVSPLNADGEKVSNFENGITFRLPVVNTENAYAKIYHDGDYLGIYEIKTENGGKYVEITSKNFSEYEVVPCSEVEVDTLDELIAALADNTNDLLIVITAQIVIPEGQTVVLDLNGKTVNSAFNGSSTTNHIYAISNSGTLTITDNSAEKNGSVNSRGIYNYGSLTLESGAINAIDGNGGYAINNESGSTFVMNGGVVAATYEDDHKNSEGGYDATAIDVPVNCTVTLNGGIINDVCDFTFAVSSYGTLIIPEDSTVVINGTHGAIAVMDGTATISAGRFTVPADEYIRTDNVIYVAGGSLVINGGTFIGDSDSSSSGSCLCVETGSAVVYGGSFSGSVGGDVWGTEDNTTIYGGTFENLTETDLIADGYELDEDGNVVVAGPTVIDLSAGSYTITEDGEYIVSEYTGSNTLTIQANATVTLQGVNISAGAALSAISIESGSVTLIVDGENILIGGDNGAGIYVAEGAALTVIDTDSSDDKLVATGNAGVDDASGAAGIGGTWANGNSGAITIDGATVVASGYGVHGSGIGSGSGMVVGEIKIVNGANVTAYGGYYADGAGTKLQSSYGKSDPEGGAAIGGGGKTASTIANITITDSSVTAYGGSKAAGIGANFWSSCSYITISGNSNVTAYGGSSSAAIGTSRAGDIGVTANIVISGGSVTAYGGDYGAAIGGGYNADSLSNLPEISVTISGGTVIATGGMGGAAIGGGYKTNNLDIKISGGKVTATAGELVSGKTVENGGSPNAIGSGANGSGSFEGSDIVISDSDVSLTVTAYEDGKSAVEGTANEDLGSNVTLNLIENPNKVYVAELNGVGYKTIQAAINAANDNDVIIIKEGYHNVFCPTTSDDNYTGRAHNLFIGKNITIKGEEGKKVVLYSYQETYTGTFDARITILVSGTDGVVIDNLTILPCYYPESISTSLDTVTGSEINTVIGAETLKFYYNQIIDTMRSYNGSGTVSESYIANLTIQNCTIGDVAISSEKWGSAIYFPGAVGSATNFVGLTGGYTIKNNVLYGGICICEGAAKDATSEECVIESNTIYGALILNGCRPTGWNYNSLTVFPVVTDNIFKNAYGSTDGNAWYIGSRDGVESALIPVATLETYLANNTFEITEGLVTKVVTGSYAYSETETEYYALIVSAEPTYVAQIGDEKFESLAEAIATVTADSGDTVIKLLTDVEIGDIVFNSGAAGKITFTADEAVTIKQTVMSSDFDIVESGITDVIIGENVTVEIYCNNSGMYLYYGPSMTLNGIITGGQNWGCLYLFNGNHTVSETGKIGTGRVQVGYAVLSVNGEIDTNYLLIEGSTLNVIGAIINAGVIYDNNNGGQRWGASAFVINNGSTVKTGKLTLSYAETVLTIDTSSSIIADSIVGAGKIVIDLSDYNHETLTVIEGDFTDFTGAIELINGTEKTKYEITEDGLVVYYQSILGEGTEEKPYIIDDLDSLFYFAEQVNGGESYEGKYFKLGASLDLSAVASAFSARTVTANWTPIGTKENPFKGEFDGNGETISNIIVIGEANQGFFGYATNATIKNLNLENVTVIGTNCVGAIAGQVYASSLIDNCHVSGTIQITGYTNVGGIVGKYYTKVTNCSVIGDGVSTSFIKGVYLEDDLEGDNVGGIMGHCGENNTLTGNTVKNITVSGTRKVGGIGGITDQNTDISECVVENVIIETTATVDYANSNITTMAIGGLLGSYMAAGSSNNGTVVNCVVKNVIFNNPNSVVVDIGPIVGGARGGSEGMLPPSADVTATGNDIYMSTISGSTNIYLMTAVAKIGETKYYVLEEAIAAATEGDEIILLADVTENAAIPSDVIFNGNGFTLNGTLSAEGNLTIKGYTKVTSFSAGFYNHVITIGEGACLEVTGSSRVTVGWGNTFNIIGSVTDAKTADKSSVQPSLIIPAGISITGTGAIFNVTNAYVQFGLSTSKNSVATENFDFNFTNSIVDFSNNLTFTTSTNGKTPVFDIDIKDSVVNCAKNLDLSNAACDVLIDNSTVTVSSSMRNDGALKLTNGSELTVNCQIQAGEHGGNNGSITVDDSTLKIVCSSNGHAMDGNNVGKLEIVNGGVADITYVIETNDIYIATDAKLITESTELDVRTDDGYAVVYENGTYAAAKAVAKVGNKFYATIETAIEAAGETDTVVLIDNITVTDTILIEAGKTVAIDLGKYTVTSTESAYVFRVYGELTLSNGTMDVARGISSQDGGIVELNNIVMTASEYGVQIYGGAVTMYGGSITATGAGADAMCVRMYGKAGYETVFTLNSGDLISNDKAISGNGNYDGTEVNITGGTVTGGVIAIYQPQNGVLNITGGTVTGATAVYMKSGSLNITGGTLIGNGEKKDYVYQGGGAESTGEALVVENVGNGGYEAVSTISITGGSFVSANAEAIGSYSADLGSEAIIGFISGGSYSSDVSVLCAEGYTVVKNAEGTYIVIESSAAVPSIGENGNWYIGEVDTGIQAEGVDGYTPVITIDEDGYWCIDGKSTGVKAKGDDGKTPEFKIDDNGNLLVSFGDDEDWKTLGKITGENGKTPYVGTNGNWWIDGEDLGVKAEASDGHTPVITIQEVDGVKYWFIDNVNQNIKAEGVDGKTPTIEIKDGFWYVNGEKAGLAYVTVEKVEKTGTEGLVDTYTVTLTDGTTYNFTVTNGAEGTGVEKAELNDKYELIITLTNGEVINLGNIQGIQGPAGEDGEDGKDGIDGKDGESNTEIVLICIAIATLCLITTIVAVTTRKYRYRWWILR